MNDYVYLFFIGRPGSGKTLASRRIIENLISIGLDAASIVYINDYYILKEWSNKELFYKFIENYGNQGFRVKRDQILDLALRSINEYLVNPNANDRIFVVEFSRRSYLEAFNIFDSEVLKSSLVMYMHAPLEVCIERNRKRLNVEASGYVPEDIIVNYYFKDDAYILAKTDSLNVTFIDNTNNNVEELKECLDKLTNDMIAPFVVAHIGSLDEY